MRTYLGLLGNAVRSALRSKHDLVLENLALRQQLAVLTRQRARTRTKPADRLFWSWLSRYWCDWRSTLVMVQPETVIRWHRTAWRAYWTWKSRARHPGRPRISKELQGLIARIATENPRWGAVRIQGELLALGYEVSAETVRCYRRKALRRPPSQSWRTFLANHRPQLWACDFFTVQTFTFKTLYVFFFITHTRHRIVHFNVTAHPTAPWVWRQLLEATPWGQQPRYLIRDRDRSYGGDFISKARGIGIETVLTPIRAPKANAIAEHVIGTFRRECLDHLIIVNERHLRLVLRQYVAHYNHVRPHQALDLWAPDDRRPRSPPGSEGQVVGRPILGGLHHEYERLAA